MSYYRLFIDTKQNQFREKSIIRKLLGKLHRKFKKKGNRIKCQRNKLYIQKVNQGRYVKKSKVSLSVVRTAFYKKVCLQENFKIHQKAKIIQIIAEVQQIFLDRRCQTLQKTLTFIMFEAMIIQVQIFSKLTQYQNNQENKLKSKMSPCPHFLINLFWCMNLLSSFPFTRVIRRIRLSSGVRMPTKAFLMIFKFYTSPSTTSQPLIKFRKWFFTLFTNMPKINPCNCPYIMLPIFTLITHLIYLLQLICIVLLQLRLKMRFSDDAMDIQQIESTERRSVRQRIGSESQKQLMRTNKYGNMKVLYEGKFLLTLGPDYACFIPTFVVILGLAITMGWFIFTYSNDYYLKVCTIAVCAGTCLSYLAVALSNPGIVLQGDNEESELQNRSQSQNQTEQNKRSTKKLCRRCNFHVQKGTFHCSDCDVCIRKYDHHCPWTSKCIGGGNIIRFYIFVLMIPVFLVYVFLAFAITMSEMAITNANKIHVN